MSATRHEIAKASESTSLKSHIHENLDCVMNDPDFRKTLDQLITTTAEGHKGRKKSAYLKLRSLINSLSLVDGYLGHL